MENDGCSIPWTEEQWNLVQQTVRDEARKVRVAASFLPLVGPLSPDAASVPLQEIEEPPDESMRIDDAVTRRLTTLSCNVELQRHQVVQPDLSSALALFRRAANIIARVEDRLVFKGQPKRDPESSILMRQPASFKVTGGATFRGLIPHADMVRQAFNFSRTMANRDLVAVVTEAIAKLEDSGHLAPFALVLGSERFVDVHTPETSLVLPADRIKPLIQGPMLRSGTIRPTEAVIVSLAGDPVDLVVASDIAVQFLQITQDPRYVFRVAEKFTLRIKQAKAVAAIVPPSRG